MANLEHNALTGSDLHEPKGVAAASSNTVYVSDGAGSGAWQTQAGGSASVVTVNAVADLPTAVSGVITLTANLVYLLSGTVDIGSNRIVMGADSVLAGMHHHTDRVVSTTTSALITSNGSFKLTSIGFNTAGPLLSISGSGTEEAILSDINVETCTIVGTVTNWYLLNVFGSTFTAATVDGWRFVGACHHASFDSNFCQVGVTGAQIDLGTATFDHFNFGPNNSYTVTTGSTALAVAASSANINANGIGHIHNNFITLDGSGVATTGLSAIDIQWQARNNEYILNTFIGAQGSCTGNVTGTSATTTPAIVALGTSFVDDAALNGNFTVSTAGRLTWNGLEAHTFFVDASLFGAATSGSAQQYIFYIAKNGTIITSSESLIELTTSTPASFEVKSIVTLAPTEYLEVYMKKVTGSDTFTADTISITCYGV